MASTQKFLDQVASWYSTKDGFYSRLVEYGFNSLKPHFSGSKCLELGPADGHMTRLLLSHFNHVTSVDGSPEFCSKLRSEIGEDNRFQVECSLFEDYTPQTVFDTVIATHILEHLPDPVGVLQRIKRWIKHDGVLILLVPNAQSFHRLVAVKMGLLDYPHQLNELDIKLGHQRIYTMQELTTHLTEAGWDISHTGGVFFKSLANAQIDQWFNTKMMDGFYELGKDFPEYAAEIFAVCHL